MTVSPDMAREIGLDPAEASTEAFVRLFSGATKWSDVQPWATPYAVSVFGQAIASPDPFGRGNGYGDGRALSLGEFVSDSGARWELQLKGSGTTPFSRGGDGRAVLRSSIREFLVSECMDAMGVPTTRALCLVASGKEYTRRLWCAAPRAAVGGHPSPARCSRPRWAKRSSQGGLAAPSLRLRHGSPSLRLRHGSPNAVPHRRVAGTRPTTKSATTRPTRSSKSVALSRAVPPQASCAWATSSSGHAVPRGARRARRQSC